MIDARATLLKSLIPALATATGLPVKTVIRKDSEITMPYIYISDIYQQEIGSKTSFEYELDVLIQIVYQNVSSLVDFYAAMNNVLSIVGNDVPFSLDAPHRILECRLNNATTTSQQDETGTTHAGLVRVYFNVK